MEYATLQKWAEMFHCEVSCQQLSIKSTIFLLYWRAEYRPNKQNKNPNPLLLGL